jgi:hypothetical protein
MTRRDGQAMSMLALTDTVGCQHDNADAYREGRDALDRLGKGRDWSDWQKVAVALAAGRTEAMRTAKTNKPNGGKYNRAFGAVLERERLDRIDSATRNQLLQIAKNMSAIEAWREKLEPAERLRLNHPSTIWRNWRRTQKRSCEDEQAKKVEQSSGEREHSSANFPQHDDRGAVSRRER